MRNLMQYPVTKEEVLEAVSSIPESESFGNIPGYVYGNLKEHFENHKIMEDFLVQINPSKEKPVNKIRTKDVLLLAGMTAFVWWLCKYGWILFYAAWLNFTS